ncbi:MAG: hypothetical protein KAV87_41180 [Desulfobacteraceae bacterium]|nr:hypothetical protein [Desulfobacteraceae bacterium]
MNFENRIDALVMVDNSTGRICAVDPTSHDVWVVFSDPLIDSDWYDPAHLFFF